MLLDVSICKKLSEVGAEPQFWKEDGGRSGYCYVSGTGHVGKFDGVNWRGKRRAIVEPLYYIPIIEDLIELCGDKFSALIKGPGAPLTGKHAWHAQGLAGGEDYKYECGRGDAPIEAIAELCIELKQKRLRS